MLQRVTAGKDSHLGRKQQSNPSANRFVDSKTQKRAISDQDVIRKIVSASGREHTERKGSGVQKSQKCDGGAVVRNVIGSISRPCSEFGRTGTHTQVSHIPNEFRNYWAIEQSMVSICGASAVCIHGQTFISWENMTAKPWINVCVCHRLAPGGTVLHTCFCM